MNAFVELHQRLWQSFRRLPIWVQLWMAAIILPANLLSLVLLDYPGARMIALAALLALGSNMLLMYWYAGFTRLMALPHLLVWGPLEVMLLMYLMAGASAPTIDEVMYICLVLAVNGLRGCENIERRSESVSWCSRQGALGEKWGSLVS